MIMWARQNSIQFAVYSLCGEHQLFMAFSIAQSSITHPQQEKAVAILLGRTQCVTIQLLYTQTKAYQTMQTRQIRNSPKERNEMSVKVRTLTYAACTSPRTYISLLYPIDEETQDSNDFSNRSRTFQMSHMHTKLYTTFSILPNHVE